MWQYLVQTKAVPVHGGVWGPAAAPRFHNVHEEAPIGVRVLWGLGREVVVPDALLHHVGDSTTMVGDPAKKECKHFVIKGLEQLMA